MMQGTAKVHLGRGAPAGLDLGMHTSLSAERLSRCCEKMVAVFSKIGKRQAEIAMAACQLVVTTQASRKKEMKVKTNVERTSCMYVRLRFWRHNSTIRPSAFPEKNINFNFSIISAICFLAYSVLLA